MAFRLFTVLAAFFVAASQSPASAQTLKVGSKNFTEQFVVAELYAGALEAVGFKVERSSNGIDFQQVASKSAPGKLAARILKEFSDKKLSELDAKDKQLQALAGKRDTAVLTGPAATQIARDVARLQREVEFARQSAQAEFQQIRTDLEADLQLKVTPVVAEIAKERNLHAVFSADSSLLYVLPALDISDEVVKRLDAEPKKSARD